MTTPLPPADSLEAAAAKLPFDPSLNMALATAGVTLGAPASPAAIPELHAILPSPAEVELLPRARSLTYTTAAPAPGKAHLVVWRDPITHRIAWATPVGPNTYRIPAVAPTPDPRAAERGVELFEAAAAAPALSVLDLPLTGAALKAIEAALLPYALWPWNEATYATSQFWSGNGHAGNQLGDALWSGGDHALGVIHGFIDRGASCFGSRVRGPLDPDTVRTLHQRYGGQTFAFDRPTILSSPADNADWLVQQLQAHPPPRPVTLDLLCHSQGGLVARELARRTGDLEALGITLGTIVFVATPNAGTPLVFIEEDAGAVDCQLLDLYRRILGSFGGVVAEAAIPMLIQILAFPFAFLANGSGVQAMNPTGPYLTALGQVPLSYRPAGVAADFEQAATGDPFAGLLDPLEVGTEPIFDAPNDIVVPTAGVAGKDGVFQIPDVDLVRILPSAGIYHLSYFGNDDTRAALLRWLQGSAPAS